MNVKPVAFTVPDAVTYSGLSRSRIYEMIRTGDLRSVQVGGRRMVTREAIDEMYAKLTAAQHPA